MAYAQRSQSHTVTLLVGCMNIHVGTEQQRNLFCGLIKLLNLDICIITETWLKEGRSNAGNINGIAERDEGKKSVVGRGIGIVC